jgi:hypothetical protein
MVDLFATRFNHRLPLWHSPVDDPLALGVDSLSITWERMLGYAFPPIHLIPSVVGKLKRTWSCRIILIAPRWP